MDAAKNAPSVGIDDRKLLVSSVAVQAVLL